MSDRLIYAMSTRGSLKIEQFNELFRFVHFHSDGMDEGDLDINARRQAIRNLDSLAYCEFDFDSRTVFMCKPELILLPVCGIPKALLVGARTPELIEKLKAAVKENRSKSKIQVITHALANSSVPSSLYIYATDIKILKEIANKAGIDYDLDSPAAWNIAQMSIKINDIEEKLNYEKQIEPEWQKRIFITERLVFSDYEIEQGEKILAEYRHPFTKQLYHWIWNGDQAAQISRDWGRYLILAELSKSILIYDDKLFRLAVPVTVPLPCLLARAAALCSGAVPASILSFGEKKGSIPPRHPLQLYSCVPPKIAQLIANKLEQQLIYTSLAVIEKGVLHA
jgi:hypothetical protein